jgi:hypothetical protein
MPIPLFGRLPAVNPHRGLTWLPLPVIPPVMKPAHFLDPLLVGLPAHVRLSHYTMEFRPGPNDAPAPTEAKAEVHLVREGTLQCLCIYLRHHKPFTADEFTSIQAACTVLFGAKARLVEDLGVAAGLRALRLDIGV